MGMHQTDERDGFIAVMLDAFGFKANDAQLATYIEIGRMHTVEDVKTATTAFRRGEIAEHEKKQYPPSPAMFGDIIRRFRREREELFRLKAPRIPNRKFTPSSTEDERKKLVQSLIGPGSDWHNSRVESAEEFENSP